MTWPRLTYFLLVTSSTAALGGIADAQVQVPSGFDERLVVDAGLPPTALAFTPDGRMLIATQPGRLLVSAGDELLPTPAVDLSARICSNVERGLLGVAVDPAFAENHYIYLYYTRDKHGTCETNTSRVPVNRVSRFVLGDDNVVDTGSELVLLDNIPSTGGNHNAGDLQFGPDGYLYVAVGDGGCDYRFDSGCAGANNAARDPHVLLGKVLRITRDGDVPPGNPFQGPGTAPCRSTGRTSRGCTFWQRRSAGAGGRWERPNSLGGRGWRPTVAVHRPRHADDRRAHPAHVGSLPRLGLFVLDLPGWRRLDRAAARQHWQRGDGRCRRIFRAGSFRGSLGRGKRSS